MGLCEARLRACQVGDRAFARKLVTDLLPPGVNRLLWAGSDAQHAAIAGVDIQLEGILAERECTDRASLGARLAAGSRGTVVYATRPVEFGAGILGRLRKKS